LHLHRNFLLSPEILLDTDSTTKSEVIMEKEVVLKTFMKRYEADIAKGLLDERGIVNMISDEDVGGFRTGMIIGDTIKLIVNEEDLEKAKETIKITG
jgi:hypothetical protein